MTNKQSSTVPSQIVESNTEINSVFADTSALEIAIQDNMKNSSVELYVRSYFKQYPILVEVARCESEFRQYNTDGSVLRGRAVRADVGVMQVNERYHLERSLQKGMDIYTLRGNLAYAKFLYEEQGLKPWMSSSPCWNKDNMIALAK